MSNPDCRALLIELLTFIEQFPFAKYANIEPKLNEIRQQLAHPCETCKYRFVPRFREPCVHCYDKNKWLPKEDSS